MSSSSFSPASTRERVFRLLIAGVAMLVLSSCGGSDPVGPATVARVSGVWIGHSTLTSAGGGECAGELLSERIGRRDQFAAHILQSGSDLDAGVTYEGNAMSCEFAGGLHGNNLDLTLTSCRSERTRTLQCKNGETRELELLTRHIAARANNGTGNGTDTSTFSVKVPGTSTSLGTLSFTASFTWNELGLPSSDFHVFDGSVRPGYVDGTTVIPADTEPFCVECGWF
jgi:hypothetical protein